MTEPPAAAAPSPGMRTFMAVWLGQTVSLLGSAMTAFALGVRVFQETSSATQVALVLFFTELPGILLAPVAGLVVDRWDRRRAMIVSDSVAALSTLVLATLVFSENLEIWHIWAGAALSSAAGTFQLPAFFSTVPLLVPKRHLGRASGMMQLGNWGGQILAMLTAGVVVATVGVGAVLAIDFATFLFAVTTLLVVRFPQPPRQRHEGEKASMWRRAFYGWTYIRQRPGLLRLLIFFAAINFSLYLSTALVTPLVLSFASAAVLGGVMGAGSAGGFAGSLTMSAWGGPRRRITGVLGGGVACAAALLLMGLRPSATLVGAALFAFTFSLPILNGCSQAIWQTKVPPDVQGRVFALRGMIARALGPLAYLLAGPLADRVFTPLLATGGPLAASLGRWLGVGPGRGIGLLLAALGLATLLAPALGATSRRLRHLEEELPDQVE